VARIEPTVGRVVLLRRGPGILAATVAAVAYDPSRDLHLLNLGALDAEGNAFSALRVPLVQEGEDPPAAGDYAEWMPYQKGQAAKADALEKQLHGTEASRTAANRPEESNSPKGAVLAELAQLEARITHLTVFLNGPPPPIYSAAQHQLLIQQGGHMREYARVLRERLQVW
jgi:hypothetical protein